MKYKMPSQENVVETEHTLGKVFKDFQSSVKHPEIYLSAQPKKGEKFKSITKNLYDLTTKLQDKTELDRNVLPELILDSMDEEQIWQQLELRNNHIMSKFLKDTSRLLTLNKEALTIKQQTVDEEKSEGESEASSESDDEKKEQNENYFDSEEQSEEEEDVEEEEEESPIMSSLKKTKKSGKKSIVDDKFFKLSEMEEFLIAEDDKEMKKQKGKPAQQDDVDYFEDQDSDEEDEEDLKYSHFFDEEDEDESQPVDKNKKSNKRKYSEDSALEESAEESEQEVEEEEREEDESSGEGEETDEEQNVPLNQKSKKSEKTPSEDEESDNENNQPKSSFEERQERLRQRIREHEEKALGEKPWQLKGEITAGIRPKNSLLEEILEFDSTTRPAPVITEETTLCLEDIIRQRIKDKAWDDVERKFKPVQTPQELRKKLVLDQDKSKESLAQIYEKEYRNQIDKLNPNDIEDKDEEPESHKEIKKLMRALFVKLDALSNFHYTPKPAIPELRIITNMPAVEVEEVAPIAVSSAKLLAPEEVRDRAKSDVLGKSERDRTDKNRERRKKKIKQKVIGKIKEQKLEEKQKMGIALSSKEEKSKLMKSVLKHRNVQKMSTNGADGSAPKSSKAFFTQLQDKVSSGKEVKVKKKAPKEQVSAKRLKL